MPKYFATRPILIGKPAERLEEGGDCTLDRKVAQPLLDKGALVTEAEWKKRQLPVDAQKSLTEALERGDKLEAEKTALRKQIEELEAQVAELSEAADQADGGGKGGDGKGGGGKDGKLV